MTEPDRAGSRGDGPGQAVDLDRVQQRIGSLARTPVQAPSEGAVRTRALALHRRRQVMRRAVVAVSAVVLIAVLVGLARQRPSTTVIAVTEAGSEAASEAVTDPGSSTPASGDLDGGATDGAGVEAMLAAVRAGDEAAVALLVEAGVEADTPGRFGLTPIMIAAVRDDAAIVGTLLAAGVDIERVSDSGESALHLAADFGGPATVETLLAGGASIDQPNDERRQQTPLMGAVARGRLDIVDVLLAAGADPSALDSGFRSVLHYANDSGDPAAVVERLMAADATWLDRDGTRVSTRGRPVDQVLDELRRSDG